MAIDFDVLIVGAGYVGSAAALALEQAGLSVGLVNPKPLSTRLSPDWDVRVFTLSPGTRRFLQDLGVWQELDNARIANVYRMEVYGDVPASQIAFDAMHAGVERLASVVEGARLQAALDSVVLRRSIELRAPATVEQIDWGRDAVHVDLGGGGRRLSAKLLVAADGADSPVRAQAGIELEYRSYAQAGVVANFRGEKPHRGRAFQWFRKDGVLAFLPLPDNAFSVVWSTDTTHAAQLQGMGASELCAALGEASGHVLGSVELTSEMRAFPLRYVRARRAIGARLALVGDAAHTVHPLAGQGVNLGLRDAEALAAVLKERRHNADVGARDVLEQYQRARLEDTISIFALTDGLQRLFATPDPVVRALRNVGLQWVDRMHLAKNALIRRAML